VFLVGSSAFFVPRQPERGGYLIAVRSEWLAGSQHGVCLPEVNNVSSFIAQPLDKR